MQKVRSFLAAILTVVFLALFVPAAIGVTVVIAAVGLVALLILLMIGAVAPKKR